MTPPLSASHPDSGKRGHSQPSIPRGGLLLALLGLLLLPGLLFATEGGYQPSLIQFCTPVEFILFAVTLLGVALFHNHTLLVAVGGLAVIVAFKLIFTGFAAGPGWLSYPYWTR